MKKLTINDCIQYLEEGVLTKSFLETELVIEKVLRDYNNKIKENPNHTQIESLINWIHHCLNVKPSQYQKDKVKFQRTAKEIWNSGFSSGCTDWAIVFSTLARQIGIPTTFLHTAELNWIKNLQNKGTQPIHIGHSFCECFYDGKWILVDPTFRKIESEYDSNKLLLSYEVLNSKIYIPYYRGLDLGKKQTIREHNKEMDKECCNLVI